MSLVTYSVDQKGDFTFIYACFSWNSNIWVDGRYALCIVFSGVWIESLLYFSRKVAFDLPLVLLGGYGEGLTSSGSLRTSANCLFASYLA